MVRTCQAFSKGKELIDANKCGEIAMERSSFCEKHHKQYHRTPNKSANDASDYIKNLSE